MRLQPVADLEFRRAERVLFRKFRGAMLFKLSGLALESTRCERIAIPRVADSSAMRCGVSSL